MTRFRILLGRGELWALISALAYALTAILTRVAVQGYDLNYSLGVTLRASPTLLFALIMGWWVKRDNPRAVSIRGNRVLVLMLAAYGLLTFVIGNPMHFAALQTGGVLIATPVSGTQVLWAAVLAAIFLRQPLNARMAIGMAVAVGGIALLAVGQTGGTPASPQWWMAVPLALGTALCWALSGVLVTAAMNRGLDQFRALAVATAVGLAVLNLYLLLTGNLGLYLTTPLAVQGAVLLAGLFNAVALVSITTALSLTSVASATTLNSLQIGLGPLLAWLLLGEQMNPLMGLGILVIAGGAIVVQRARQSAG
ncbi:MAG: DMT family transporter [Chloroflexi bacterium]|nr:DMT family transporter [Chloroflexota bacterium]MBU1746513.1 DMT family transporter [Chloroflexota bacterium]MBU1877609.1 DMT family transporter [Chloroflexota bacterium]